jgi:2-hydroxychromene-2-carboxylate isomerase
MGELVFLSQVMEDRSRPARGPAAFFFALDCPLCYLAAERVERALGEIDWIPVLTFPSDGGLSASDSGRVRGAREALLLAEQEARALRLPLVEPHDYPFDARPISRAAAHAAELGVGAKFALAAMRLAFCGGYDLSDPEVIGEAAEVTGLRGGEAVAAAGATRYDERLEATSRGLASRGVRAPAIRIGKRWFQGVDAVTGASMFEGIVQRLPLPPA